jgi:hypothetical protein
MNNRALWSAIAVCFAVAACTKTEVTTKPATTTPPPKPADAPTAPPGSSAPPVVTARATTAEIDAARKAGCKGDQCKVDVTVSDCKITATPPVLGVADKSVDLKWSLKTADHEFTDNGITFKNPDNRQFTGKTKVSADTFKWTDANSDTGVYDYTIEVKRKDGTICRLDPSIVNGAS